MHLYGGNGKHSKRKPEKDTRPKETDYDYDYGYEDDYDYEPEPEPQPQPRHTQSREQPRRSEQRRTETRHSEPKRRSRRDSTDDIRSTNHTVYSGNGYDYEDDVHFASDAYISREEQRRSKHRGRGAIVALCVLLILCVGAYAGFIRCMGGVGGKI